MARTSKDSSATERVIDPVGPIVSAAHLASGRLPSLSEMEFALTMTVHAFHRWTTRCVAAAGVPGLAAMDVQVLHSVMHRGRPKTLADLCLVLNIEDTHVVSYAVKKLERMDLVKSSRRGKEKVIVITAPGEQVCQRYKDIREAVLINATTVIGLEAAEVSRLAATLRSLSGLYDQAARVATSL